MIEQPISISSAAKRIGMHKSTLASQVAEGKVRSHEGKVLLSEVLEDRAKNIDLSRSGRRKGRGDEFEKSIGSNDLDPTKSAVDPSLDDDDPTLDDASPVIVDGHVLAYRDARALKETYLARLRQLEFQIKSNAYVEIEVVGQLVEREYSVIRDRLLVIPGKMAVSLADRSAAQIEAALRAEVNEVLTELSCFDDVERQVSKDTR